MNSPTLRLGLMVPVWQNPGGIVDIILQYYACMEIPGVELEILAVTSPHDPTPLQASTMTKVYELTSRNRPVSNKFNSGMHWFRRREVDAVMYMGSDDIITMDYFLAVREHILERQRDYVYSTTLYFYDVHTQRCFWTRCNAIGACATFTRELLEKCNWHPYPDNLNMGIDSSVELRMTKNYGADCGMVSCGTMQSGAALIDVKSFTGDGALVKWNIHSFAHFYRSWSSTRTDVDGPAALRLYCPEIASEILSLSDLLS